MIEEEYLEHLDSDSDELYWMKEGLKTLTPVQRKIYITWLEAGTYADAARVFGVSKPTLQKYVKNLTNKIREYVCEHLT